MLKNQSPRVFLPQFPESYWIATASIPSFPRLTHDIQVDVAIVGAGISGITTAYLLSKQGLKVALIEAGQMLTGTTGHTTAKITAQHDLIYDEFISHLGKEQTRLYYEANREAFQFIKQTIHEHQISCDFTEEDAYIYTSSDEFVEKIAAEFAAYEALGIPGDYLEQAPLPFQTKAAVVMKHQAQFNPMPYLLHLANHAAQKQGCQIYEHTTAVSIEKGNPATVITNEGHRITCKYAVSCSHFPFYDGGGFYFAKMHAKRAYILAVKTSEQFPGGMFISAEEPKRSLRSFMANGEKMVLIAGESHKTGQGICTFKHYEALQNFGEQYLGIQEICYRWSAQDLVTLDKLPYIGRTDSDEPNILVATGYKKWGMTTGTAAALLIEKLVTGGHSPYQELFKPDRFHADPSIKTFIVQNADVVDHFISGKLEMIFKKPEELQNDEGAVVRANGKRAGAYRDQQGQLHIVDTTCTHMGCEVEWNDGERTWDCPCHGSRFSYKGGVLEGPAKKPLKRIE
ncbi:FAD-dependent oxidoreductase [Paenibacillus alginolyticus]|uniref:FAD-dependent oxidoreductase n=1 Tax=Paenibacillus alginolyticus TaxID=59839 RepID=A0ABT4GGK5_9BACL|nr:FAD-dependent oxidoreductase [Paenibacillus alginolyticus]MCY9668415.1 FAD-dependent oxidoreductase [Paenibacillus alginolyticus]MCY9695324.1 FAD-dependent oxidoreductase [Paenibacillus alginolyticus]MEC0144784.1 FAD-dependent oxidoreductase [Paenibacillus alginolyticus]